MGFFVNRCMETTQINHSEYQKKVKKMDIAQLQFIIKDCREAIAAMPNGHKAGYYQDEIHYCNDEIYRRNKAKKS